ncbi:unnamed protein product [Symbiodinium natans]|uniref:Crossover junction endonuclease MUS81 n=1 Tax=Symbiodinium natans TaxID=878477 RepID=A0A812HGG6_9DINO|nr:unnamed protein product [Symbiodinium natans]
MLGRRPSELQWLMRGILLRAAEAVRAVSKEQICRGDAAAPAAAAADRPAPALAAPGGGYAILRALWDAEKSRSYPGFMTKDEICKLGQKYCDEPMKDSYWDGREHGHGWESNKSLLAHRLISRQKHKRTPVNGFRGPKDQIALTEEGRRFVPLMLANFKEEDDGRPPPEAPAFVRRPPGPPSRLSQADEAELRSWVSQALPGKEKSFQVSKARRQRLHELVKELNASGEYGLLSHDSQGAGRHRVLVIRKEGGSATKSGISQPSAGSRAPRLTEVDDLAGLLGMPGLAPAPPGAPGSVEPTGPGQRLGGKRPAEGGEDANDCAFQNALCLQLELQLEGGRKQCVFEAFQNALCLQLDGGLGLDQLGCTVRIAEKKKQADDSRKARAKEAAAAAAERRLSAARPELARKRAKPNPPTPRPQAGSAPPAAVSAPSAAVSAVSSSSSSSSSSDSDTDSQEDPDLQAAMRASLAEGPTAATDEDAAQLRAALRLSLSEAPAREPPEPAQAAASSPGRFARRLSVAPASAPVDLDNSDDSQGAAPAEPQQSSISLVVDRCERQRNRAPREIYEELRSQLEGSAEVRFESLKLGDYLWLKGDTALGACVERKTVRDLVGRSARGDHLRQIRRLGATGLPGMLLLEGPLSVADNKAIPYGADFFSNGPTDPALRDSEDVLEFLAWTVLYSPCDVLLTSDHVETAAWLSAWTLVLRDSAWAQELTTPMTSWRQAPDASDAEYGTLLEAGRAAGFNRCEMDAIGSRFPSVTSLQKAYERCRDRRRRQLLLARLLLNAQGDGEQDEARALRLSIDLFQAAEPAGQAPVEPKMPTVKLERRATQNLAEHLRLLLPAGLLHGEAGGAERVRLQLHGTGDFSSWRSAPCHVHLLEGTFFLRFLQPTLAVNKGPGAAAEHAAAALARALALSSQERHVILVYGLKSAASRAINQNSGSPLVPAAKKVQQLFPAVVAVLILKHKVNALSWSTRQAAINFVEALSAQLAQGEMLQE